MMDTTGARDVITRIERTFGHDLDGWLSCFDEPLVFVTPDRTMTFESRAAARPFFEATWVALHDRGFDSTHADDVRVRMLGEASALVDARFTRRRADGTELEQLAALYVCRRRADSEEWGVAALVHHPHGVDAIGAD